MCAVLCTCLSNQKNIFECMHHDVSFVLYEGYLLVGLFHQAMKTACLLPLAPLQIWMSPVWQKHGGQLYRMSLNANCVWLNSNCLLGHRQTEELWSYTSRFLGEISRLLWKWCMLSPLFSMIDEHESKKNSICKLLKKQQLIYRIDAC